MPINTRHPDHAKALPGWVRMRHFIAEGRDGVKGAKKIYLPKPEGLDEIDYESGYLVRAPFFPAAQRTARALSGTLIRKAAAVSGDRFKREFEANFDLRGTDLQSFIARCCDEMMQPTRFGILVDRPSPTIERGPDGAPRFVPPPRILDRPYGVIYDAESIINWGEDRDEFGVPFTSFVVLEEPIVLPGRDRFKPETGLQWRLLVMDGGIYRQQVYRLKRGVLLSAARDEDFELFSESVPSIGTDPWTEIPFEPFGPHDNSWEVDEPLLMPVVNVNWDHYMRAADWVHSLHFTACPMPWAAANGLGPDAKGPDGQPLVIKWGSSRVLMLPENGVVNIAEVTGAGAEANLGALRLFQEQLAHLGAQFLAPEKRAAEAADTLAIRTTGQTASLATVARVLTNGMTRVARWMMQWQAATPEQIAETKIEMNTDFVNADLSAQELTALVAAHQAGDMPDEDFFWNLDRGGRIRPGQKFDEWNRQRQEQAMAQPGNGSDLGSDPAVSVP